MGEYQSTKLTGNQFGVDGRSPETVYEAVDLGLYGINPKVTRETFELLFRTEDPEGQDYSLTFDAAGTAAVKWLQEINYEDLVIEPDGDGNYRLGELCWMWLCPEPQDGED